jgi:membrane protein implicated in regulation of membrane protease activity
MKLLADWSNGPNDFQRWVGTHPYLWALIIGGGGFLIGAGSAFNTGALAVAFLAAIAAAFGLASLTGALLMRRKIRGYERSLND